MRQAVLGKPGEKRGIIESATISFGNMSPAIIDQKSRFSAKKLLKYNNISFETGGGATQFTKSYFEPKRAHVQIKKNGIHKSSLGQGFGRGRGERRFLPFKNEPHSSKSIFLN